MPIVTFLDADISTWIRQREIPERTDGPHVSKVIVDMLKTAMPDKFGHYGQAMDGDRAPQFEVGYTWEDVLSTALRERHMSDDTRILMAPHEIVRDGIYGTPDRVLWDRAEGRWTLEELKATWFSCGGLDVEPAAILNNRKFLYWCQQLKTYAAMLLRYRADLERRWLVELEPGQMLDLPPIAHVRALFINGDYKYGQKDNRAKPMCWRIEWTLPELETWWNAVVRHVIRMNAPHPGEPIP